MKTSQTSKIHTAKAKPIDFAAGEKRLTVFGEEYTLRYGFTAIAGFEEGTGVNPAVDPMPPTLFNFMCLLYAGLSEYHPEVSIETVQSWFNEETSADLCRFAWESFYGALPEKKKGDSPPNPPSA